MTTDLSAVRSIAVGSTNPVKIAATRDALMRLMPHARVDGVAAASGVPDQPWGDDETIRGAVARARAARVALDADFGVGIEGGVVDAAEGRVRTCAWAAVVSRDGREGVGGSLSLELPPQTARLVRDAMELGHPIDTVARQPNPKHVPRALATP